jgi:hypothetical protein
MASGDRFIYSSQALLSADLVIFGASVLNLLTGHNPGADAYLLIFDDGSTPPLTPGTIPDQSFPIPSGAEFSWAPSNGGRRFTNGIQFAVSSTPEVLTASPVTVWVDVEGREL